MITVIPSVVNVPPIGSAPIAALSVRFPVSAAVAWLVILGMLALSAALLLLLTAPSAPRPRTPLPQGA